jgi:hypothetical protein
MLQLLKYKILYKKGKYIDALSVLLSKLNPSENKYEQIKVYIKVK